MRHMGISTVLMLVLSACSSFVSSADINSVTLRPSVSGEACGGVNNVLCDGGFEKNFNSQYLATNVSNAQQPSLTT